MWWVALALTLALMGLFHLLTGAGPLEARATLALGFLLLVAHLGGELARRVRLPRITGFLVTGFAVGPAWLGLVRADEVAALGFISDAAVALIAFAAGSELTLDALRQGRAALARVSAGAIAFPFVSVAAVVLVVQAWFPLTVHQPFGDALAVALVLGAVAAASSPAVTMAVMDELDARGPFARAVLGVTVIKDIAVIVLFTLVLGVAQPLASAGALNLTVAVTAMGRLAASLAVGAALGYLGARLLRLVRRDTPLFLIAVAFLTAEIAELLGFDALLIALAAGFWIQNFSRVEGPAGARPVYLVFFVLTGAGLHLEVLMELWPWAVVLVGVRAAALRLGTQWAGKSAVVTPALAQHGWLGLISQAGVALGLASVARRAFPEWGISLEALLVAMIGVHEMVGPIGFRRALRLAGEVMEAEHVTDGITAAQPGAPVGPDGVR